MGGIFSVIVCHLSFHFIIKSRCSLTCGENECFPGNPHHALIRPTTGRRWKQLRGFGEIGADNREITIFELPNIRAAGTGVRPRPVRVRVCSDSSQKHTPIGNYCVGSPGTELEFAL